MQNDKDYEQLYYDQIYENKKLKKKIEKLEEQIAIYTDFQSKNTNRQLTEMLIKYFKKKRS